MKIWRLQNRPNRSCSGKLKEERYQKEDFLCALSSLSPVDTRQKKEQRDCWGKKGGVAACGVCVAWRVVCCVW